MTQENSLVGYTLGNYQIVELIGEGGMATVYKAWQPSLRRYVALKVLASHLSNDAEFVQRFHQEAVSAANLKHTNIVTIHDVGAESGYHYIAMEFIEGMSLEQRVRSGQAFEPEQVVDVISQIGSALDYAHQRGFIHRDIKPANVLVEASGRAVLTDFGIVKALSGTGVTSPLTQAGTVFGTPQYMSPEQVKDEPLDHRSDLYALGIVCYEMLSGQVPFDGTTTHSILYAQVNNPPPPLREFSGLAVPPPVEAVVNKMLAKERGARYDSAGEFARDLAQAVSGVWPAGMGSATAVVTPREKTKVMQDGAQPAAYSPTVSQPWQQPVQPAVPQQPTPTPPPQARGRTGLMWGLVGGGAALMFLVLIGIVGFILKPDFLAGLLPGGGDGTPTVTTQPPTVPAEDAASTGGDATPTVETPTVAKATSTVEIAVSEQIAFTSERDGNAEIYVMNSDGSEQTNLTNSPSADFRPRWSADGARIAFHSYEEGDVGGNAEIYMMDADGRNWIRLTRDGASDKFPDWSPDGQKIIFVSDRDGNFEIYVMNNDGTQVRRLTDNPAQDYFPAWSPDGDRILFESDRDGDTDIYVMDVDGGNVINLTLDPATDSMASWSPDSSEIAFTSDRTGRREIWAMDDDGGSLVQLTTEGGWQPSWSPDGARIVFVSDRDGDSEIYVMDNDGGDQIQLTYSSARDLDPWWSR